MLKKAKEYLEKQAQNNPRLHYQLLHHIPEVEHWASELLHQYPSAQKEIVMLAVYLHDIGHTTGNVNIDHAVRSEEEVRRFLPTIGASSTLVDQVAQAVRSHRNNDISPRSIEEKIIAVSDSLSHMTSIVYADMARLGERKDALAKLERDYRDTELLPGTKEKVTPLYSAWKTLLTVFPDRQHLLDV